MKLIEFGMKLLQVIGVIAILGTLQWFITYFVCGCVG
jgi:hypothetical protein